MVGAICFIAFIFLINKLVIYFNRSKKNFNTTNDKINETKIEKKEREYKNAIPITMGFICFLFVFAFTLDMENIFLRILISVICGLLGYRNTIIYAKKYNDDD